MIDRLSVDNSKLIESSTEGDEDDGDFVQAGSEDININRRQVLCSI